MYANFSKGQALIENVLLIPVIVITVVMVFWFARIVITRQQLLMAARYGTDLIVHTKMSEEEIRNEVRDYLCGENVEGRRLNPNLLKDKDIRITIWKQDKVDFTHIKVFSFDEVKNNASSVEIIYKFDSPRLFSAWDSYIPGSKLRDKLVISARSEVLAGTGCKGE